MEKKTLNSFIDQQIIRFSLPDTTETRRKIELYYNDLMLLENNKVFLEEQYAATPEAINFQAPFIITYMPPAWKYCIGIFVGGVLGLIVACIVKNRKKIKDYLKEK